MSDNSGYSIVDKKKIQLAELKNGLEDLELYLREIEHMLDILDTTEDETRKQECRLRIIKIQQYIMDIGNTMVDPAAQVRKNFN